MTAGVETCSGCRVAVGIWAVTIHLCGFRGMLRHWRPVLGVRAQGYAGSGQ